MNGVTKTATTKINLDEGAPRIIKPVFAPASIIDLSDLRLCHHISASELAQVANDISLRAELLRWSTDRFPDPDSIDTIKTIRSLSYLSQQLFDIVQSFVTTTRLHSPDET